ncbi:MAG: hypothetical protein COV70_04265 [Parcubacteria group bacterium CG11_big_fil_rev_8_21_14_0_20_39_22]|nr:MAG: hypothetical protein COV70_04265 [Parcubacteria group bacterium CG11_big_fil_rev_8_21_14_0_20_39_22]
MPIKSKPAQEFVPIKEVRDGIVVLKSGAMRGIVMASSVNFALKSSENQTAIISQFQNYLNSLDFSTQIYMQSRRLDIRPYIALLEERYREQVTDLMKVQTREYIGFIKNFTESTNIMTKTFFIVVPFAPASINTGNGGKISSILPGKSNREGTEARMEEFEENRSQLEQRMSVVEQGLVRCGIRVAKLGTEEVIELFYKIFNPGDTEKPMQVN